MLRLSEAEKKVFIELQDLRLELYNAFGWIKDTEKEVEYNIHHDDAVVHEHLKRLTVEDLRELRELTSDLNAKIEEKTGFITEKYRRG